MRRGFDRDTPALLATVGVRLDDPELVKAAAKLIRAKTEELRALYQASDASPK